MCDLMGFLKYNWFSLAGYVVVVLVVLVGLQCVVIDFVIELGTQNIHNFSIEAQNVLTCYAVSTGE